MSTLLNLLNAPEFADDRLTETINVAPYRTGRPAQLGIFTDTPIATTYVKIGIRDDEVTIIPARERGGPANKNMGGKVQSTIFEIPHFPLDDAIGPSDIQNVMAWGEENALVTVGSVYNDKLSVMRSKHDATHHHLDWGALNGLVLDAEGKLLFDIYGQFDLEQIEVDFALGTADTDLAARARVAKAEIRKELRGAGTTGVRVFAGKTWFENYVGHQYWRDNLKFYPGPNPNPARDEIEDVFRDGNWIIERVDEEFNYRQPDGTFLVRKAVEDNEAIAVPLGTPYGKRYNAPPDTLDGANKRPTDKIHISTEELPHGKGKDIHSESNVLPVNTRPKTIVKLTMS
ncbi:major capsid protein [Tianweitania sp. BSSL-BM11]|uniref:Major capsid protein n=1 Tax=Tianweitania aestuarii TaxID=2814886 RepID=A0ABS5RV30_9HYPH|nr:major capsid protein [Tianweitania aestuarii]MBS9720182.1 major capsid protein [Tianweitania aestuarii]